MGSGKTTVGKLLAEKLSCQFFDTDQFIEQATGRKVKDIIHKDGFGVFSVHELEALSNAPLEDCIVSTGGKTYLDKRCRDFVDSTGKVIFLNVSLEEIEKRLTKEELERRMIDLRGQELMGALAMIKKERYPTYKSGPSMEINGDGGPEEICERIIREIKNEQNQTFLQRGINFFDVQ